MLDSQDIFITETDFRKRYEYSPSDLLGEGGFAQVYKAFDKQFQEYVALKFYNKGEKGKYDVLHEMKDSRSFSHKNIIRIHDAFVVRFEFAGTFSYVQVGVLEFANAGNLRDFINTKPSGQKLTEVLTGILEGLKYLHLEKNIIHRDLSPENILMVAEGSRTIPKISDFGISKKLDYDSLTKDQIKSTQLLGKVDYMAPEQFSPDKFGVDGKINTNVDLWAFGVILYEIFMNRTPFGHRSAENPLAGINSIINDPVLGLEEILQPYKKAVERCLVKNAGRRVQNPEELIVILNSGHKQFKPKTTEAIPVAGLNKNLRYLKRAGILLILPALIVAGYFAYINLLKPDKSKAVSKIGNLVNEKKYAEAILYFEKLPEAIKSDSVIKSVYQMSMVCLARDSLNTMMAKMDYHGSLKFLRGLKAQIRKDPEITVLNDKITLFVIVDSLLEKGKGYFEENKYREARICFNSILENFDPQNTLADSMIKRIDRLSAPAEQVIKISVSSGSFPGYFSGRNLIVDNPADPKQIRLLSINLKPSETKITLQLQPSGNPVIIYSPRETGAFYIELDNGSQLPLIDVQGVVANAEKIYSKPVEFYLFFARLPENITRFNLIEGKNQNNQNEPDQHYFNFKGIRLIEK